MDHLTSAAEDPDTYELFGLTPSHSLPDTALRTCGMKLRTHGAKICAGERCVIHNPTDHHMRSWPLTFRADKQFLAERTCEHGVGHPDPDSLAYYTSAGMSYMSGHGCCGCCAAPETAGGAA